MARLAPWVAEVEGKYILGVEGAASHPVDEP